MILYMGTAARLLHVRAHPSHSPMVIRKRRHDLQSSMTMLSTPRTYAVRSLRYEGCIAQPLLLLTVESLSRRRHRTKP